MKVMSYNILCAGRGENAWEKRIPLVVRTIRNADPDVFGVQEAHYHWMRALMGAFPDYAHVGVGRDNGKKRGEFSAVFYKKDAFRLLDSGNFWLSETPDVPKKGWDAVCIRICSWAKLQQKADGKTFVFMNTHLDHVGQKAMQGGAELIGQRAAEIAGELPVILTGDFNVTPDSVPCLTVKAAGFADTRDLAPGADTGITFNNFETEPSEDQAVIDYIFIKGPVQAKKMQVVRKKLDGHLPSDHYPVVAQLQLL